MTALDRRAPWAIVRAMRGLLLVSMSLLVVLATACSRTDEHEAPVQVLIAFATALERSVHDPTQREQAYALLDASSQEALDERAALARSLAGRELQGWEMLVPGRLHATARELRREGLRARVEGAHATIALSEGEAVDLVREPGGWRIHLLE